MINQKGGCGKSSSCFHLAGALAQGGYNVLLVDADPQGSLSQGFFGPSLVADLAVNQTLAALFDEDQFFGEANDLILKTDFERISVVPANQRLATHNRPDPEQAGMIQFVMRDFLDELTGYDIILVDCPPNLYQCSWNTMVAADYVIIPVPPEDFGTQGLLAVHQCVENARKLNPKLRRLGHLVTRHDKRLTVHRTYDERLRKLYGALVLDTVVPEASAFKLAIAYRQPVEYYDSRSKAAESMRLLVDEIMVKVSQKELRRKAA